MRVSNATTIDVSDGDIAHFTCSARGETAPSVSWWHSGRQLTSGDKGVHILFTNCSQGVASSHLFVAVTEDDQRGGYVCKARAQLGKFEQTFTISKGLFGQKVGSLLFDRESRSREEQVLTVALPRVGSISNFSCSITRIITSHRMENLAFNSLLRWNMIMTPILTTYLIHFSFKGWENVLFERGSERVVRKRVAHMLWSHHDRRRQPWTQKSRWHTETIHTS